MKNLFFILIAVFCLSGFSNGKGSDTLFVAFWNLENLFDTKDDDGKIDSEYTPEGELKWTLERLDKKIADQSRVIRSMNEGKCPDLIGFSEVEHQCLLDTMIARHFKDKNYKVAYAESPDMRGIDNGLIYNAEIFSLAKVKTDTVNLLDGNTTRLILSASLVMNKKDTVHVFVNHWPSRRGGQMESEINRVNAANVLRKTVSKLFSYNKKSKIIIIGDFNDEPGNISIMEALNAHPFHCQDTIKTTGELFNTSFEAYERKEGSLKFQETWNLLDQIVISDAFLNGSGLKYICGSYQVYRPEFMITKSGKFQGTPHPTYGGKRYLGGCSDHFPVTAKFLIAKTKKLKK